MDTEAKRCFTYLTDGGAIGLITKGRSEQWQGKKPHNSELIE